MAGQDSPFIVVSPSATKSGSVNLGPISGIREMLFWENDPKQGDTADYTLTAVQAYKAVPWLYRSVNLRANTVADIPWVIVRGDTEVITSDKDDERTLPPELAWIKQGQGKAIDPTQDGLTDLLRKVELDLCLTASAYWHKEANRVRTTAFRRWLPSTITPIYDAKNGLMRFDRQVRGAREATPIEIADLPFWWLPSVDAELGPGTAPAMVALRAAGLMSNIDTYGEGFFSRGAINTTLLTVEGNPAPAEMRRLETWWRRLVTGNKKAYETAAVPASVKPVMIGQPPKDLALDTLTEAKRKDVAVAMGVPASILDDESANYATARVSLVSYYRLTIGPELELIETALNQQVFGPLGLEFRFKMNEVEALQAEEAQKAYETLALVIGGVMTPDELRDQLNMEPVPGGDVLRLPPAMSTNDQAPARTNAGMANQMTGGDSPRTNRQAERQLARNVQPNQQPGSSALQKALEVVEMADVFHALMPPVAEPVKAARVRRMIERDDEGRIVGVTEVAEPEVVALADPFLGDEGVPYP